MTDRPGLMRRLAAPVLLVASIAPILFVALPMAREEHDRFESRYLDREPLEAPAIQFDASERRGFEPLPEFGSGVPVLAYHGIGEADDRYSVGRAEFARQMAMLERAGVETLSIDEYVAFLRGEAASVPERAILITFDDGKLSSYRGADAALERHGMRATMYAIAGSAEEGSEYYLSADELSGMAESGRWDVQLHAGDGHHEINYDAAGHRGPFYTYRAFEDGALESFAEYRRRVTDDISAGERSLAESVEGFGGETFSFPFGAYGQYGTNDRRIPRFLVDWLSGRFEALFHQPSEPRFTTPGPSNRVLDRFEVRRDTSTTELYGWLGENATGPRADAGASSGAGTSG